MIKYDAKALIVELLQESIETIDVSFMSNWHGDSGDYVNVKRNIEIALEAVSNLVTDRCCSGCLNWNSQNGGCDKFQATPPIEFQLNGCNEWSDPIPF